MKIRQVPVLESAKQMMMAEGSEWVKAFSTRCGLGLFYSLDKTQHGTLHHLSISRAYELPSWEDVTKCKNEIMGDIDVMMILPKKIDYVNLHYFCFHLWETPEGWNVR